MQDGVARISGGGSLIEVLDRVLDKGIVIDAHVRVLAVGIELISVDAQIVVASITTYLEHADVLAHTRPGLRPPMRP
jgi:gas vesicle structural protein